MKSKKILALALCAITVAVIAVSSNVGAYMRKETEEVQNVFVPADVDCEVIEQHNSPLTQKTMVRAKNTSNVPAYIRLRIVSYWVDDNGDIVYKSSPEVSFTYNNTDWLRDEKNDTYYYKYPVAADTEIPAAHNLLKSAITLKTEDGYRQVVEIFAEAIQADPTDAVVHAWDVTISGNNISGFKTT